MRILIYCLLVCLVACKNDPKPESTQNPTLQEELETFEKKFFPDELEARAIENQGIVPLWNQLINAPRDKRITILAEIPFDTIQLAKEESQQTRDLGISFKNYAGDGGLLQQSEWKKKLQGYHQAGILPPG